MVGMLFIVAALFVGLGVLFARGTQGKVSKVVGWAFYVIAAASLALAVLG
jgi:Na+(H+)/acetate symporter ActP